MIKKFLLVAGLSFSVGICMGGHISEVEPQQMITDVGALDKDNSKISDLQLIKSMFYKACPYIISMAMGKIYLKGVDFLIDKISPGRTNPNSKLGAVVLFRACMMYFSDHIHPRLLLAKELPKDTYASVYEIVRELSERAKIPMPKLWKSPDMTANASVCGIRHNCSSIVITHGALQIWSDAELRAVLSHEVAHIKNRDALVQELFGLLSVPMNFEYGGDTGYVVSWVLWLLSRYISRVQEFRADKMGAGISDDPASLASALKKMFEVHWFVKLSDYINSYKIVNFFSTHPPTEERIQKLKGMTATNT